MDKIFSLSLFLICFNFSFAQTIIPGGVVSGTWTAANSPYLVQGAIMIADGTTLTIDPGVRVEFQGQYKFLIMGRLLAQGTVSDSITFTATDTTAGWLGIRFDSTAVSNDTSYISFCHLEYGKADGTSLIENGGAIYLFHYSKVVISDNSFFRCTANVWGGAIAFEYSNPKIIRNVFRNNNTSFTTGLGGGAIYGDESQPYIYGNTFMDNSTEQTNDRGGAICLYASAGAVIDSNTFINNASYRGGAIFCSGNVTLTISRNNITGNSATAAGSGICLEFNAAHILNNNITDNIGNNTILCEGSNPQVTGNLISDNIGSGIRCSSQSTALPSISSNVINNNTGGGIDVYMNSPTIVHNFITNNSGINGAAIRLSNHSTPPHISNNVIANNSADSSGGAIYCSNSNPLLINNTIVNNTALKGGGLYFTNGSDALLNSTILYGNTASVSGNQVYLFDEASDPHIENCDVQGGSAAFGLNTNVFYLGSYTNNIDTDPLFTAPSAGSGTAFNGLTASWDVSINSPVIDAGLLYGSFPATDIAGNPRVSNGIVDIGAYEFVITGMQDQIADNDIVVYPNPSKGDIHIQSATPIKFISVKNSLGQIVYNKEYVNTSDASFRLFNGIYIFEIFTNGKIIFKKVVVME